MKTYRPNLLTTAALAVGAFLLLAPNAMAAETNTRLNSADTEFIQEEATAGLALVRIAELGVKKSERADIKAFAGMIVTDHSRANAELATLAESKGVALTSEVDSDHADTYEDLEGESGADFDKEFLSVMVSSHKRCVENFEEAAKDSQDSEVKQWAAKMLPAQKAHLLKAEQLSSATTAKTGAASRPNSADAASGLSSADAASSRTSEGASSSRTSEPDNTARNARDRDARTLTPLDQGNSKTDIDTTAQIRKEILSLEDISINAQNVKIITNEGRVTLRGPVNSEEEKSLIGEIASRIAPSENVDNQLEVRGVGTVN